MSSGLQMKKAAPQKNNSSWVSYKSENIKSTPIQLSASGFKKKSQSKSFSHEIREIRLARERIYYKWAYSLSIEGIYPSSEGRTPESWLYSTVLRTMKQNFRYQCTFGTLQKYKQMVIVTHKLLRVMMFASSLGIEPVNRFPRRELR